MTYSGKTVQAAITNADSREVISSLFSGATSGSALTALTVQNNGISSQPWLLLIAKTIPGTVDQINFKTSSNSGDTVQKASQSSSQTIYGNCGGSANVSLTADSSNNTFSGTGTFSSYCMDGITINGSGSYSGSLNSQQLPQQFSFNTSNLNVEDGSITFNVAGTINFSLTWDSVPELTNLSATEDLLLKDSTGNIYWIDNFNLGAVLKYASGNLSELDLTLAGTFYDPVFGYVTVSTPSAFVFYSPWDYPSAGALTAVGANNSSAILSVPSYGYADIKVDADGDGIYEYDTGSIPWSSIQ
ncbi:MAG: hypothetical protein M0Z61_08660 [Nitrospiraceae bacterium]|nr:hypothetical protein [Nitrospiraceae bacterium]